MRWLKTQNVPKSFAHIKSILLSKSTADILPPSYFCSKYDRMSANETHCFNINCDEYKGFRKKPPILC
ncbi:unnamed protein product, partial [Rotaria sp. Silwood1]